MDQQRGELWLRCARYVRGVIPEDELVEQVGGGAGGPDGQDVRLEGDQVWLRYQGGPSVRGGCLGCICWPHRHLR